MKEYPLDFCQVDALLDKLYPQMEADLLTLLAIPSVEAKPTEPKMPFGADVAAALEKSLEIAASLQMKTANIDGYMGIAELLGTNEEAIGVLAHVDVVPASANDWLIRRLPPRFKTDVSMAEVHLTIKVHWSLPYTLAQL